MYVDIVLTGYVILNVTGILSQPHSWSQDKSGGRWLCLFTWPQSNEIFYRQISCRAKRVLYGLHSMIRFSRQRITPLLSAYLQGWSDLTRRSHCEWKNSLWKWRNYQMPVLFSPEMVQLKKMKAFLRKGYSIFSWLI